MKELIPVNRRNGLTRYLPEITSLLILFYVFASPPVYAEYGDVIINKRAEKAGMRPVIFPHWFHRIRYKCTICHTDIGFKMRVGTTDVQMSDIVNGKFCGACHNNQIAWGPENCHFCHSGLSGLQSGIYGGNATDGPGKW